MVSTWQNQPSKPKKKPKPEPIELPADKQALAAEHELEYFQVGEHKLLFCKKCGAKWNPIDQRSGQWWSNWHKCACATFLDLREKSGRSADLQ